MRNGQYLIIGAVFIATFIGLNMFSQGEQKPVPDRKRIAIEKWSNNQLLDMSYNRYIEVYDRLKYKKHRESLATEYMSIITSELFVFSSEDQSKLYVTIQEPIEDAKPISYGVKVMAGGSETGLYDGYVAVFRRSKIRNGPPPFHSADIGKLLSYIIESQPITDAILTESMFKAKENPRDCVDKNKDNETLVKSTGNGLNIVAAE